MIKNKFLRLASVMLVCALGSLCAVSNTFAKYTTSSSGTDKARVAYWGFNAPADLGLDLFDGEYGTTVKATAGDVDGFSNVIAPGTSKTADLSFTYTDYKTNKITAPEVSYSFTVTPTVTGTYTNLDANANFKWTLQKAGETSATEYGTVADLLEALKSLSGDTSGTKNYDPGQLPDAFKDGKKVTVGWKWEFYADADGDTADTSLGNAADLENVDFTITITATQID